MPQVLELFKHPFHMSSYKGLFLASIAFVRIALKEVRKDFVPGLYHCSGGKLCDRLKFFILGEEMELPEKEKINPNWFAKL